MELLLSEDGTIEKAVNLQQIRSIVKGNNQSGNSTFYVKAVLKAELPAAGLDVIPAASLVNDMPEEYAKLGYFQKKKVKKADIKKTVDELLEIVDLHHKENAYPSQLSGGQRQRVAIARALATYPSVLLCDEATSALDSMTTEAILSLLKKINKERKITMVIITHEIDVVKKICNKVAVLDQSKVVETGNTDEIFANPSSPVTKRLLGGEA